MVHKPTDDYDLQNTISSISLKENLDKIKPDLFWTSGLDEGREGVFGFANSKQLLHKNAKYVCETLVKYKV